MNRHPYPSDVSEEEWALVLPYISLTPLDASQRKNDLREVFHALRWWVRTGYPPMTSRPHRSCKPKPTARCDAGSSKTWCMTCA